VARVRVSSGLVAQRNDSRGGDGNESERKSYTAKSGGGERGEFNTLAEGGESVSLVSKDVACLVLGGPGLGGSNNNNRGRKAKEGKQGTKRELYRKEAESKKQAAVKSSGHGN